MMNDTAKAGFAMLYAFHVYIVILGDLKYYFNLQTCDDVRKML